MKKIKEYWTMIQEKLGLIDTEEWIWVAGYKGVYNNMEDKDGFQYEPNVKYAVDGRFGKRNSFKFCLSVEDVDKQYCWCDKHNRYFEVMAFVRASEFDRYSDGDITELHAKRIVLKEEITCGNEIFNYVMMRGYRSAFRIETLRDMQMAWELGPDEYVPLKYTELMHNDYSESFKRLFVKKVYDAYVSNFPYSTVIKLMVNKIKEANAYIEENVSKDIAVYLLMKDI